jgi:hypothetical protein
VQVAHARGICGGLGAARGLELAFIDRCVAQESRQSAVMISDHFQHERADVVCTLRQRIVKTLAFSYSHSSPMIQLIAVFEKVNH